MIKRSENVSSLMKEMIKHTSMNKGDQRIKLKSKGSKVIVTTGISAKLIKYLSSRAPVSKNILRDS